MHRKERGVVTWQSVKLVGLVFVLVVVACAAPPSPEGRSAAPAADPAVQSTGPKKVVAAVRSVPKFVAQALNSGGGGRIDGGEEISGLVSAGLVVQGADGKYIPHLAEALPSTDAGTWRILPDGGMETILKLREGALWHDGRPVSAEDVAFTAQLDQDREMPWLPARWYPYISGVEAVDPRTVKVSWKQAYIFAERVDFFQLMPKHILEEPYLRDKSSIPGLSFWTSDYVGTGPFRVKDWVTDSHVSLVAFDRFVLGTPRLSEIEVRFIPDDNTLGANLLAGTVQMTLGPGFSLEQGTQIRDRWSDGQMSTGPQGNISLNVQHYNPDPPILLNPQFRRALLMAIDRQQLVDELVFGSSQVIHNHIHPVNDPEFPLMEPFTVKYPYDPRRSGQMIEELGYRKGSDGLYVDTEGKPLSIQIMATQDDSNAKPQQAILQMWKEIGITPDLEAVTQQRQRDLAYRANFRNFSLQSGVTYGADRLVAITSREARLPENNYIGSNYSRYMNPQVDALVDRYHSTIPWNDRMQVLGQIVNHYTDQLVWFPLYMRILPSLTDRKIANVTAVGLGNQWWNAHTWDLK
jgi:peptide/nickel transport system substrate-binding protein